MYLSPPLIMDPVDIIIIELSSGGMKFITATPIPTRFLFAVIFRAPFAQKIYAEAKVMHTIKGEKGFSIGSQFTNIKFEMQEKIDQLAEDYNLCNSKRLNENPLFCRKSCAFRLLCDKKNKTVIKNTKEK